jgi:hypothetical protein
VTGLQTTDCYDDEIGVIKAHEEHFGRWDSNNGKIVINTEDGQVWLAAYSPDYKRQQVLAHSLCPKGTGAFVPCSNGETIHVSPVLRRIADPYEGSQMTTSRLFCSR